MNGNARPSVDPDYVQGLDGVAGGEVLEDAGEEGGEAVADAAGGPQVLLREGAVPGAEDEGPVPPPNQPAQGREEGRGVEDDPLGRQGSSPRHLEGGEGDPVEGGVDGAGVPPQQDRPLGGGVRGDFEVHGVQGVAVDESVEGVLDHAGGGPLLLLLLLLLIRRRRRRLL